MDDLAISGDHAVATTVTTPMTDTTSDQPSDDAGETRELTTSRVVPAAPERVYEAFLDPDELAAWQHPPGVSTEVHHLEPEVGGTYRITMHGATDGTPAGDEAYTYGGTYEDLVPGERIVQIERGERGEDAQGPAPEMTVTTSFDAVDDGTEVTVTIEIPASWPDDAIGGWTAALEHLEEQLDEQARP